MNRILSENDLIPLSPKDVDELIFGCDELWDIEYQSVDRNEYGGYRPRIVRREVGAIIRSRDPKEEYLHVALFNTHAEVWRAFFWRDSLSKRLKAQEKSAEHREREFQIEELTRKVKAVLVNLLKFPDNLCTLNMSRLLVVGKDRHMAQVMQVEHILYPKHESETESESPESSTR